MIQASLLQPTKATPLPPGSDYYVPAVFDRKGEREAIENLSASTWEKVVPIIHFLGPREEKKDLTSARFTQWSRRVAKAVGKHSFYLDLPRLSPSRTVKTGKGDVPILDRLYEAMHKRDTNFIPVANVGARFEAALNSVADCALADGNGFALRYRFREPAPTPNESHAGRLSSALEKIGLEAQSADLIIDFSYIDPDDEFDVDFLAKDLQAMFDVAAWRSVVLLGSSIPPMMSCVKEGTVGEIERREWSIFEDVRVKLSGPVVFGDYTIQCPTPPTKGGPSMRRTVRYTSSGATVVARGQGDITESDDSQYKELCLSIRERPEFCGGTYSWGDETIARCAEGALRPRAQEMWRGAGTSHHIKFVRDQLQAA
ncbi:MAG: beta family protein [Solirubrobacterales bacterium]